MKLVMTFYNFIVLTYEEIENEPNLINFGL